MVSLPLDCAWLVWFDGLSLILDGDSLVCCLGLDVITLVVNG